MMKKASRILNSFLQFNTHSLKKLPVYLGIKYKNVIVHKIHIRNKTNFFSPMLCKKDIFPTKLDKEFSEFK